MSPDDVVADEATVNWADVEGPVIAVVAAVRTGRVRTHSWGGRDIESGAVKTPVQGRVMLRTLGFDGDEQADTKVHGGPNKAVLFYAGHHYPTWRSEQGLDLPDGALFENITLRAPGSVSDHVPDSVTDPVPNSAAGYADGVDETSVAFGEVWRLGDAVVQITQSRSPCFKLARRWGVKDLVVRVQNTGWSGWYGRVLVEGEVGAGDTVQRLHVPDDAPQLAEVARVVNVDKRDLEGARRFVDAPGIPDRWRQQLRDRLAGKAHDDTARLTGEGV